MVDPRARLCAGRLHAVGRRQRVASAETISPLGRRADRGHCCSNRIGPWWIGPWLCESSGNCPSQSSVSEQVSQAVRDPSLAVDAKVERINSLAGQFNQLVGQWQQQRLRVRALLVVPQHLSAALCAASHHHRSLVFRPHRPRRRRRMRTGLTSTPSINRSKSAGGPTADQLRAQITAVSRQMAQASQDLSLSADVKTEQLSAAARSSITWWSSSNSWESDPHR